jgi:2-phospho-L-lactate/phosphoenolpyruvate guanylyltransferase
MSGNGIYAVIPVKRFTSAKQRLSSLLNFFERARLARFMFEDVLTAANAAKGLSGVVVVTSDINASVIARKAGAHVITEKTEYGYPQAVSTAVHELKRIRASGLIVIPADIPQLNPRLIDDVLACTASPGVTIIPARIDGGTNLLAMRPCDLVPPLFGQDSMARHSAAARDAGVEPTVFTSRIAGQDLDRPDDLMDFLTLNSPTRAHRYLAGLALSRRRRVQLA